MLMKTVSLASALAGAILFVSGSAALAAGDMGEFGNNCAWGLTQGVKKYTDCSVSEKIDGKLYCFSKQSAKTQFMEDPESNIAKAEEAYAE
jgi:YHS domain-containing protein